MRHLISSWRLWLRHSSFVIAMVGLVLLAGSLERGTFGATCDPPGPPPRFGCEWSTTACDWFCAVCDPFGAPPRSSCGWDLNTCNWNCPGYTGVDVMVKTQHSPTQAATVYVKLSSLCSSTGAGAFCEGSFAVHAGMPLEAKCAAIANVVSASCAAAGYAVSANDCASDAIFTVSNVGCPATQFALGVSNDPGVFDQSATQPLPDGEVETICAPPPGEARNLRLEKLDGGASLRVRWDDGANAESYLLFEDQVPSGSFNALVGTALSGASGVSVTMPVGGELFLVASRNSSCGVGPKR